MDNASDFFLVLEILFDGLCRKLVNKLIKTFEEDREFGEEETWWPPCLHIHA